MKKTLLALDRGCGDAGSASAADLAARPYVKAPMTGAGRQLDRLLHFRRWQWRPLDADQERCGYGFRYAADGPQRQGGSGCSAPWDAGYDWQFSGAGSLACQLTVSSAASAPPSRIRLE